ncbi:MAG: hypothetical protein OXF67_03635 [Cyanobacteria bacterium MAG CAR4_bin_6]|nr:hypothetical protein [Cyanobacteria bacterium MAG CAR4_bin_6]
MPALPPGLGQWVTAAVIVAVAGLLINQLVSQLGKRMDDRREASRPAPQGPGWGIRFPHGRRPWPQRQ